ncbi:MAG: putative Ig domain-containing protein [Candidatus Thiodiazotropha sp.]
MLSACGGSDESESNETANNSEQETIVSNDGETSDTDAEENNNETVEEEDSNAQDPVVEAPPAPVVETPPAETVKPTNPSQPSDPEESNTTEESKDSTPDTSSDTKPEESETKPEEGSDVTDTVDDQSSQDGSETPADEPAANRGTPQLNSATISGDQVILAWSHNHDAPEGGFDVVIDSNDTGADRTHALTATISGLDLTIQHCFLIEARYTDSSEFLRSNQVCSEAQEAENQVPTISGEPAASVDVGAAYSFTPTADDADEDNLTFSVINLPAWASFNASNGHLSGTPAAQDVGDYNNIQIQVSDGTDRVNLEAFSIRVNAVQVAATTGSMSLNWSAPTTRTDGTSLNLSEISGYQIYVGTSRSNLQMVVDVNQGHLSSYTIENMDIGDYYVALAVYDRNGNSSDLSNVVQKSVAN